MTETALKQVLGSDGRRLQTDVIDTDVIVCSAVDPSKESLYDACTLREAEAITDSVDPTEICELLELSFDIMIKCGKEVENEVGGCDDLPSSSVIEDTKCEALELLDCSCGGLSTGAIIGIAIGAAVGLGVGAYAIKTFCVVNSNKNQANPNTKAAVAAY